MILLCAAIIVEFTLTLWNPYQHDFYIKPHVIKGFKLLKLRNMYYLKDEYITRIQVRFDPKIGHFKGPIFFEK